jgi:MFS family permease
MIQKLISKVADKTEPNTDEGQRIQQFGRFFTGYMGTAALATAALPIPVKSLHLIPAFASQEKFMNTYTSMSCFLAFAYVFYSRHTLARWMFGKRGEHFGVRLWVSVLPVFFICCSIGCAIAYHYELGAALDALAAAGAQLPSAVLLSKIDAREIPGSGSLIVAYLGMFVFAESAFVLMAIREYLQDVLKLEERELIFGVDPKKLGARQVS